MGMIDHFGLLAPFYNRIFQRSQPPECLRFLRLEPGTKLLDAGGGSGRVTTWLQGKGLFIVVGDASLAMLRQARKVSELNTACMDTETLGFTEDTFDAILMVDALHHVKEQSQTLRELWRVVKPGGRIVIEEPNIHRPGIKLLALMEKVLLMRSHFWTPERIAEVFMQLGARVEIHYDAKQTTAFIVANKNW
ncbi:class I SAM-dependent methyltransferase [Ornatilinea apprima]|uniref:class I SAM-dependent methyltransferase n=1 Tax=Ornatilinea apprima TaxID=1134406 RepID=UPI0009465C37|nr:class I SAM-dependent methyltransferase [Ornatilinea apprima]